MSQARRTQGPGSLLSRRCQNGRVTTSARKPPQCPLRLGDPCTACVPGATGPADCPTVWRS